MKWDNFVFGVSSIDYSMINLGKRVWSESLSESDSACRRFNLVFFFARVLVCIHGDFCRVHWLCSPPTTESYEGKCTKGKPIRLGKSGLRIQYTHTEETNQQFGISVFIPKFITHLEKKSGNIGLSPAWLTLQPPLSASETYRRFSEGLRKRARHVQPIGRIGPLRPPVQPSKGQSGVLLIMWPLGQLGHRQPPGSRPKASRVATHGPQVSSFGGRSYPSTEVQSVYSIAPADKVG